MGSMFGGGGKAADMQKEAMWRESVASQKQDVLVAKQEAERTELKAEEDKTKQEVEDRRRRMAAGLIGRRSLFTNDETGYVRGAPVLGTG